MELVHFFRQYEPPAILQSDNGTEFTANQIILHHVDSNVISLTLWGAKPSPIRTLHPKEKNKAFNMLEGSQYEIILDNTSEVAETGRDDDDGIPKSAMALASHNKNNGSKQHDNRLIPWLKENAPATTRLVRVTDGAPQHFKLADTAM
ncbi:hypothetical protein PPROV_000625600 [Pycnococcus provasolii]|uniref:Uncharacterized protein n=1 Tax=Pycnococcus provasolii TaxID=41880 RepID=A0A830HK48_9CHLO|nr:hypothetical protein PPROV_000625600 [Pycnococcus provasolii]